MTVLSMGRGGPSALHEARVEMLGTLATLCAYEGGPDILPDGTRPDVLRLRARDRTIFIGDAKATETPGNSETYERLSHYASVLSTWTQHGHGGVLALAVEARDAFGWLRTLRALVPASDTAPANGRVDFFDDRTAVICVSSSVTGKSAGKQALRANTLVDSTSVGGLFSVQGMPDCPMLGLL